MGCGPAQPSLQTLIKVLGAWEHLYQSLKCLKCCLRTECTDSICDSHWDNLRLRLWQRGRWGWCLRDFDEDLLTGDAEGIPQHQEELIPSGSCISNIRKPHKTPLCLWDSLNLHSHSAHCLPQWIRQFWLDQFAVVYQKRAIYEWSSKNTAIQFQIGSEK